MSTLNRLLYTILWIPVIIFIILSGLAHLILKLPLWILFGKKYKTIQTMYFDWLIENVCKRMDNLYHTSK